MDGVRPSTADDDDLAIAAVARSFGFSASDSGVNPRYLQLLREHGRLVVAQPDGAAIVGFGGMIEVAGTAMITDLFVLGDHRGRGLATCMLGALVDGFAGRMTFSSAHPAAQAVYRGAAMSPQWALRYMRLVNAPPYPCEIAAAAAADGDALTDRPELLGWRRATCLHLTGGGHFVGHAIVTTEGDTVLVDRLAVVTDHHIGLAAVLNTVPSGTTVEICVPEMSTAAAWLDARGAREFDRDLHMASAAGLIPANLAALNPGLA